MLLIFFEAISNSNAVIRRAFRKLRFQMIDDNMCVLIVQNQPRAGLVQLGLRITFGTSQYLGNLVVLVPLNIVQDKYCAVTHRQLRDAACEIYSVNQSFE
jgi:hypothetical protein